MSNLIGIRTVGAELFHEDKQDRHNIAGGSFSQFCERDWKDYSMRWLYLGWA